MHIPQALSLDQNNVTLCLTFSIGGILQTGLSATTETAKIAPVLEEVAHFHG